MKYVRWTMWLLITLSGLFLLAQQGTTQAQGGNLLANPGFDGPYSAYIPQTAEQQASCPAGICQTAQVPNGWYPFWIGQTAEDEWWENRMPEYKPVCPSSPCAYMNRVKGGEQALQYFNFEGANTAGVWQRVTVPANARLTLSAWGQAWSSDQNDPVSIDPTSVNMRVGIDPLGGNSPFAAGVVWSAPQNPYDAYAYFEVQAAAQGETVSVFLLAQPAERRKHNDFYWDEASLVVTGVGAAAPAAPSSNTTDNSGSTSPSSSLSGPTPTPNAEGLILITVQPGDTMWAIAARAGIALDEFLALNPGLTKDSFIRVGEQYTIGQVAPATATPEPTATPLPEAPPGPTAEPDAAPMSSSAGTICLQAFTDSNQNGLKDGVEAGLAGVVFTVMAGNNVVSNYLTDGFSEPYCLEGMVAGSYRISRSFLANEVSAQGTEQVLMLTEGGRIDLDWGSYGVEPTPAAATSVAQVVENDAAAASPITNNLTTDESMPVRWLPFLLIGLAVLLLVGVIVVIMRVRRA